MAQPPTRQPCGGLFAYQIKQGQFGEQDMTDLNVVILVTLYDGAWAGGEIDVVFFDSTANEAQRHALQRSLRVKPWLNDAICPRCRTRYDVEKKC